MAHTKKRKINGFDFFLIFALILMMVAAWFFLFHRGADDSAPTFEGNVAFYYVEVTNLAPWQLAQVSEGDWVRDGVRLAPIGHVYSIETRPHELRIDNVEAGEIYFEEVPGFYTMVLTIQTSVTVTERDILAEGQFPIKGGATLHFVGPGFAFSNGIILGIERGPLA